MKRFLLSFVFVLVVGMLNNLKAQCEIANFENVSIQVVGEPELLPGGKCKITFNVQFDLEYNAGAKYVYFTSYLANDYTSLATSAPLDFACGSASTPARDMPTETRLGRAVDDIGKSFLDIGLDLSTARPAPGAGPSSVNVITSYFADPDVVLITPANSPGLTVTRENVSGNIDHFVAENVTVIINQACNTSLYVKTDIFASNASDAVKAQCYLCGLSQLFNDPTVTGFMNCDRPRQFSIGINTQNPTLTTVTYRVFIDINNNGVLNEGVDIEAYNSVTAGETIQISSSAGYSSGLKNYLYNNQTPEINYPLLVEVDGPTLTNAIVELLDNQCAPLPVVFKSFTAARSKQNVLVKWETASEQNNKGFHVQRRINGDWENIAFVFSAADNGNSSTPLAYSFNDLNSAKGISQYRILQVDLDGRGRASEIRSVRGEGLSKNLLVYPNPSLNGKVNVVFEESQAPRNVIISDMSGRVVKQYRNVTANNLLVENLETGVYSIQVTDLSSSEVSVEKVIIKKR